MGASVTTVDTDADLIAALGPRPPDGRAMVLVGGADEAGDDTLADLRRFFATLVAYVEASSTAVVDGGTDSGVMRLVGEARAAADASFRLIGVAPRGALERRTRTGLPIRLADEHPEILLVPGSAFGDETMWLFGAADHLAGQPAPTLVVNGGRLTMEEAQLRLAAGYRVVAVEGSGRAADELAADAGLRRSGKLRVVSLSASEEELGRALES